VGRGRTQGRMGIISCVGTCLGTGTDSREPVLPTPLSGGPSTSSDSWDRSPGESGSSSGVASDRTLPPRIGATFSATPRRVTGYKRRRVEGRNKNRACPRLQPIGARAPWGNPVAGVQATPDFTPGTTVLSFSIRLDGVKCLHLPSSMAPGGRGEVHDRIQMTDRQAGPSHLRSTRILLVDDHAIVRHGMRHLLNEVPGFHVYAEAGSVADALRRGNEDPPDLLVMEFAMEGEDGLEFIRRMAREIEDLPILVLSRQEETLYAERALRAGARGYVMKEASTDAILDAVQAVARGEIFVSDRIRNRLVHRLAGGRPQMVAHPLEVLTDREVEVFRHLGRGLSTREVGERLGISVKTVETHRAKIMRKLDLDNASQLVHRAIAWTQFGESVPAD